VAVRIIVAVVGKPRDAALATAIRDYEARASRYWPLEFREVRAESAQSLSPEEVRTREGERLAAAVPEAAYVIACDIGGVTMTSEEFAQWLQRRREQAKHIAFVIGGAYGLGEATWRVASTRLALAPWTLPHELARLVLAEQLYRAGTIIRREPYHK
jgi:23S rRNA (pseudouridine1915-N3)-methyltransferase